MSDHIDNSAGQSGQGLIVDRLYDVALDPVHYEHLVDVWADKFSLDGSAGDIPPDDNDEVVHTHAQRASVFLDRYKLDQENRSWQDRLNDVERRAAFMMDGSKKVLSLNAIAKESLGLSDNALLSDFPFEDHDLQSLKDVALRIGQQAEPVSVVMRIRRTDTNRPLLVRISPVESDRALPVVLVVLAEIVWLPRFSDVLCETFKFTKAEADVVRHIVAGLPAAEISTARKTSLETVRSQIKSILDKAECNSQTELVRTVIGFLDVISVSAGDDDNDGLSVSGSEQFETITLSDGRRYDYRVFGDTKGIDCLYMHMDYGFVVWTKAAEAAAREQGLRVIVPVRAGYGQSELPDTETDFRQRTVDDMLALLAHLNVDQFVILAQASDLRFALAMAPQVEGRLLGIIGCAAQLPLQNAAQYERMDKWQRFINWNARYAPKLLPFLVKAGFQLAQKINKERFFEQVNGGSPADMQTFSEPDIKYAILTGSDVCLSDTHIAHVAFSREVIDHEDNWYELLRDCPIAIELYQGDQDPQSPLETVEEITGDLDHISVEIVENAGQILFFKAWPQVLPRVRELHEAQAA